MPSCQPDGPSLSQVYRISFTRSTNNVCGVGYPSTDVATRDPKKKSP